jgi:hypothetical protein
MHSLNSSSRRSRGAVVYERRLLAERVIAAKEQMLKAFAPLETS